MEFQGINLSARTLKRLHAWTEREAFSHAYIFAGPPEADKMGAARAFLKTAYCLAEDARPCGHCIMCTKIEHGNHEDLLYVQREGSSIGVKQIEDLQQRLRNKPYASERISAVIEDADKMTPQSQNKLLKTLEEPNPGNILILLSENPELLLKTIQSRCVLLKLEAASQVDSTYADLAEVFMRQLLDGAAYYALSELLLPVMEDRDAANLFLDALERRIRDLAVSQAAKQNGAVVSPGMLMEPAGTARRDLNMGINCKYAMKNMVLDMQGEREQHG